MKKRRMDIMRSEEEGFLILDEVRYGLAQGACPALRIAIGRTESAPACGG